MFRNKKILLAIILPLVLAGGFLLFVAVRRASEANRIYGAILPHHMIVKDRIDYFLKNIKGDYEAVVLIAPNHMARGVSKIIISDEAMETSFGKLEISSTLETALAKKYPVENDPVSKEFAVQDLAPLIKRNMPRAKFVPIILKSNLSADEAKNLAENIYSIVDPKKTLVLATVDFSHYLPAYAGEFHDLKSRSVLESFDFERIYDLEVDSRPALYALSKYLERAGAQKSELSFATNSGFLSGNEDEPGTTHNFYYFRKGESDKSAGVNFLFFGNFSPEADFREAAGEENRFFEGIDVISANPIWPAGENKQNRFKEYNFSFAGGFGYKDDYCGCTILRKAGKNIGFLEFDEQNRDSEENFLQAVNCAKKQGYFMAASIKWKNGKTSEEFAHKAIDAGADMVVGYAPAVGNIEVYKNKPIFYSLGDFENNGEGLFAGIYWSEKDFKIFFFPAKSANEKISLEKGEDKKIFLKKLSESAKADEEQRAQIETGYLFLR